MDELLLQVRNMTIKLWKLVFQAVDLQTKQLPELRYCKKSWVFILADLVSVRSDAVI